MSADEDLRAAVRVRRAYLRLFLLPPAVALLLWALGLL